jgi:hypothetical protein
MRACNHQCHQTHCAVTGFLSQIKPTRLISFNRAQAPSQERFYVHAHLRLPWGEQMVIQLMEKSKSSGE